MREAPLRKLQLREKTEVGAAPEVAAAAAGQVEGVEDGKIFGSLKFAGSADLVVQ